MNVVTSRTLEFLLLPPGNLVVFVLLALLLYRWRGAMLTVLFTGILQTVVLSLPVVAEKLMVGLEQQYLPVPELWLQAPLPEAIVILGAERNLEASEYGGRMSASTELERLNYAAHLHRKTGLPLLLSGSDQDVSFMREVLENTFQVPLRWQENQSHTTWENAAFTDQILTDAGIRSAWVVTHAWHMPRAMQVFAERQVQYFPASLSYGSSNFWRHEWLWWIPQANALARSQTALHEWLGLLAYELKH
ncbi:YdcF family protein [Thiothrix subterranea]|uniref:YdcF family protein n=1 Tax=Thiothrix subterranea TaxID=2735563 RepID=UPI00192C9CAE|nr:YdcF family protein [Thiothrix subterranea]QQZ29069.1 YdcF family protein [Thiothrix subterranea]